MSGALRPTRERIWIFGLVVAVALAAFLFHLASLHERAVSIADAEDDARAVVQRLVAAQDAHKARTGRFGTLVEIHQGGGLDDVAVRLLTPEADAPHLLTRDYRYDLLLPSSRSGEGRLLMIRDLAKEGRPSTALRGRHHAVVARPRNPGRSGFRILYADEAGDVWVSEGVSDEVQRNANPLPRAHLGSTGAKNPLGLVWMRWTDIEAKRGRRE